MLDIYVSLGTPIVLFVRLFGARVTAHGLWMVFAYGYIFIFFI